MDTIPKVREWLREMGHDGDINGINFKAMITPAMTPIWMQLVRNVRPKQEIDLIRKRIIINRLLSKRSQPPELATLIELNPLRELEIFNKKSELEKQLGLVKRRIKENDEKLKELMLQNRVAYVTVENLRNKIESNQRFTFLLKAKAAQLRRDNAKFEEMLAKTLTRVDEIKETDEKEIMEILKTCAQKLEMHIKQQKINDENSAIFAHSTFVQMSARKNISSATKQLIPSQSRKALTPILQNSVLDGTLVHLLNFSQTIMNDESFLSNVNVTVNESQVRAIVQDLLRSKNRLLIFKCLMNFFTAYKTELPRICTHTNEKIAKQDAADLSLMKVYGVHVKYELLTKKHEKNIKSLEAKIESHKKLVFDSVNHSEQTKRILELRLQKVGITAAVELIQKELSNEKNLADNENDIRLLKKKINATKEKTRNNLLEIQQYLVYFKKRYEKLLATRNHNVSLFERPNRFTEELDCMQPIPENLHSQEIEVFSTFPLEKNRMVKLGDKKVFLRDVCVSTVPSAEDLNKDALYKFASLVRTPCSFPERILFEIIEAKERMEEFEKLNIKIKDVDVPKYSLQELRERERYVEKALERFDKLIHKDGSKMNSDMKKLRDTLNIWLEMPFGNYISKDRLVNGQNFEFYEKQYNYYYNQL